MSTEPAAKPESVQPVADGTAAEKTVVSTEKPAVKTIVVKAAVKPVAGTKSVVKKVPKPTADAAPAEEKIAFHVWNFFKAGGSVQVAFKSGSDVSELFMLDQKLWMALSCPTTGMRYDARTLEFLDSDKDGRIRAPEILAAIEWLKKRLNSLDSLLDGTDAVPIIHFNPHTEEGKALQATVKGILAKLNKADSKTISLAESTGAVSVLAASRFNGDGVVPIDCAADDMATADTLRDILACMGAAKDVSSKDGVDQKRADEFFAAIKARLAWYGEAKKQPAVLDVGQGGAALAAEAMKPVAEKIDDFFTRCELAAYDSRCEVSLNGSDADIAKLGTGKMTPALASLKDLPLAKIGAGRSLPLTSGVNPYWVPSINLFKDGAVSPILGTHIHELSKADWEKIKTKLAPFLAWQSSEKGKEVAALPIERLELLDKGDAQEKVNELIRRDLEPAAERALFNDVEKLIRLHAYLVPLLNNYVNMGQLYDPAKSPIFRVGSLYMDARACNLCFEVDNLDAFSALASASKCCLLYCAIKRPGAGAARTICAAVTAGFSQTLWVGRNGIFYDLDGKDWEATIVKIDAHEISLKEAFWAPWRKIAQMVTAQVNKLLNAKQDAVLATSATHVEAASTAAEAGSPQPKKMDGAALASSVAAIGIAVGLLGSAVGGLFSAIAGIPVWKACLGVVAVILAVSLPSMLITWFKLRGRDLAPILNAGGWAVNRRLGFSLRLGRLWTSEAKLPPKSKLSLKDPFADSHPVRIVLIILVILAIAGTVCGFLWRANKLNRVLPIRFQHPPYPIMQ